jgi:uncharacterized protein YneF (UPF0154 family)
MQEFLILISCLLIILGFLSSLWSFRKPNRKYSRKKLVRIGGVGVILALIGGIILICFYYAKQPVSERIIKENLEKNYPCKSLDVSAQENLQNKGAA